MIALVTTHAKASGFIAGYRVPQGYRLLCDDNGNWQEFTTELEAQGAAEQRHMECKAWRAQFPLDPPF